MESQPQNSEYRKNPENFHPCYRVKMENNIKGPLHLVSFKKMAPVPPLIFCHLHHWLAIDDIQTYISLRC